MLQSFVFRIIVFLLLLDLLFICINIALLMSGAVAIKYAPLLKINIYATSLCSLYTILHTYFLPSTFSANISTAFIAQWIGATTLGLLQAAFFVYALHRWALHSSYTKKYSVKTYSTHWRHHGDVKKAIENNGSITITDPEERKRVITSPGVFFDSFTIMYLLFVLVSQHASINGLLILVFMRATKFGYLFFENGHYGAHVGSIFLQFITRYERIIAHHRLHHQEPKCNFGVMSRIFDFIFGTLVKSSAS